MKTKSILFALCLGLGLIWLTLGLLPGRFSNPVRAEGAQPAHLVEVPIPRTPGASDERASPRSEAYRAPLVSTRYVSSVSGVDTGDCTSPSTPCATIQYAIDQAASGDEIWIATRDGTTATRYTGIGIPPVITLNKSLTLRGGYITLRTGNWVLGPNPAVVDGEDARRVLYVGGAVSTTLELLAFVNGQANRGGNIYAEDANLRFIATFVLSGNATYGGGLYLKNSEASLTGLAVYSNTATDDGGGLYLQGGRATLIGGVVQENQAKGRGGGFFLESSDANIIALRIYSNTATDGGGFYLDSPDTLSPKRVLLITNNYIRYNRTQSGQGGGFYLRETNARLINNIIADNQAIDGAALYLWASSPLLIYNTIAQNSGQTGLYATHKPGAISPPTPPKPSRPVLTNTILTSHTIGIYVDSTNSLGPLQNQLTLAGTLWWTNGADMDGPGEIVLSGDVSGDPRYTCTGDLPNCLLPYHLLTDSVAIDMGVTTTLTISDADLFIDIDGQLRPSGKGFDLGADEVVSDTHSVQFVPSLSIQNVEPGQSATHTHLLINSGVESDTYDLAFTSDRGWTTLLAETTITMMAQTSTTVQVRVTVPNTATNRMKDRTIISATSQNFFASRANALDITNVVSASIQVYLPLVLKN